MHGNSTLHSLVSQSMKGLSPDISAGPAQRPGLVAALALAAALVVFDAALVRWPGMSIGCGRLEERGIDAARVPELGAMKYQIAFCRRTRGALLFHERRWSMSFHVWHADETQFDVENGDYERARAVAADDAVAQQLIPRFGAAGAAMRVPFAENGGGLLVEKFMAPSAELIVTTLALTAQGAAVLLLARASLRRRSEPLHSSWRAARPHPRGG